MDVADPVSYVAISSTLAVLSALLQEQVFFDSKAYSHFECPPNHSHGAPVSCSINKLRTLMNARWDNGRRWEDALLLFAYYGQCLRPDKFVQSRLRFTYCYILTACVIISDTRRNTRCKINMLLWQSVNLRGNDLNNWCFIPFLLSSEKSRCVDIQK